MVRRHCLSVLFHMFSGPCHVKKPSPVCYPMYYTRVVSGIAGSYILLNPGPNRRNNIEPGPLLDP